MTKFTVIENSIKTQRHSIGNLYIRNNDLFILASVEGGKVYLIRLSDGEYWASSVYASDLMNLTESEFNSVCGVVSDGNPFVLVNEIEVKVK